jgi:VCBS repeat protein/centrosomal CEP192-like protein
MNRVASAITMLVCVFLSLCAHAVPQKYLFNKLEMPTGKSPESVAVGDFNRDGYPDFVVVNNVDATVSVYMGKADGTFTALAPFSTGAATAPTAVAVADFNGDGKPDLAVTLNGADKVAIFTGKGDGTFNAEVSFGTGSGPIALVAADFNGDKKFDLAIANNVASSVTVLLNHSTTTLLSFTAATGSPYAVDANPVAIATGLFNNDKLLDLAVASGGSNNISILLGASGGAFGAASHITVNTPQLAVATGDMDGDGKTDLVVGTSNSGVFIVLGKGDGTFNTSFFPGVFNFSDEGAAALAVLDINGDKKLDVITVNTDKFNDQSSVSVMLNHNSTIGNPTFAVAINAAVGFQPAAIALADFNHDGRLDAVVVNRGSNTVSVLLGDGQGHFDPGTTTANSQGRQSIAIVAADFNKDGKLDLAISSPFGGSSGGVVTLLKGSGTGSFTQTQFDVGNFADGIVAADLNGDGFMDVAVVNKGDNTVSILLNNKSGGFTVTGPYPTGGQQPVALAAGNFRLTGHMDLAIAHSADGTLTILPNDGTGKFGAAVQTISLGSASTPSSVVAGDFNGDGNPDVAVGTSGGSSISVFLNSAGHFGTPNTISNLGQVGWLATASLRNNGILDLVAVAGFDNVSVLLGNGNGTFAAPAKYPVGTAVAVTVADVTGDGVPDLIVANEGDSTIGVLAGQINSSTGKPTGTFSPQEIFFVNGSASTVDPDDLVAGDFNKDGFMDIAAVTAAGSFSVYLNTPAAALSTRSLAFPVEQLGSTSGSQTAQLFSSGVASLKPVISVSPSDYTITSNTCTGVTLVAGTNCSVSLDFSPKDINTRAGTLIFKDAAVGGQQKVSLSGTGTEVNVNPSPVAFGSVARPNSKTLTVTIKNLSGGTFPAHALTFNSIAVNGTGFALTGNSCPASPSSLGPGLTCQIQVTFTPNAAGNFSGTLTLTDNGGASPQKIVLTGTGT